MISFGDIAPDFDKVDSRGLRVCLSELRGRKVVVLYFYPMDFTPGCTIEACGFRDNYTDFVAAGAVVIGVSSDSLEKHAAFQSKHDLPFSLLSDEDGTLAKAYGVRKSLRLIPGRMTFIIDRQGVVQHMFTSQLRVNKHVTQALGLVRQLRGG